MKSPNILFLTVDCLRYDRIGDCGNTMSCTPHLDRLIADHAISFTQAYANGPNTLAAFPSLMTSSYSTMYDGTSIMSDKRIPIAEVLAQKGYATMGLSSNPYLTPEFGYDRGFNVFQDTARRSKSRAQSVHIASKLIRRNSVLWRGLRRMARRREISSQKSLFPDAMKMNAAIWNLLAHRDSSKPFFLWCHYMDLHYPFIVSHLQLRSGNDTPPTMNEVSSVLERVVSAPSSLTEADQRLVMQIYDVSVSHVDKQLGELVEQLQSEGIWDNTVVLVCADHGEELFEHGRYGHSAAEADNPFPDELIHIPLILKLPYSQSAGIRVDEMVCQLDIPATLCALAGAEKPPSWLGRSLLTLLRAQSTRPCGEVLTQEGYRHAYIAAYRTSGWKLIVNALDGAKRLYKLSPTADESTNVATEYHDVVTRLYEEVRRHFSTHSNAYSAKRIANVEIDEEMKEQLRGLGYLE